MSLPADAQGESHGAAIITGGGSGIGRATARAFAALGIPVAVVDRNAESAETVASSLRADFGVTAVAIATDVTDGAAVRRMVAQAEEALGPIRSVSLNAGIAIFPTPAEDIEEATFDSIMAVNVKSIWLSVIAVVPALRRAGGGSIVITGSIMGERPRPQQSIYAASKAAANHLARSFALEYAADGIRVNAVAPVATDTAMLPAFLGDADPENARERFIQSIPLGRLAEPEDVADATIYLSSAAARFITGVVLPVDGGRAI